MMMDAEASAAISMFGGVCIWCNLRHECRSFAACQSWVNQKLVPAVDKDWYHAFFDRNPSLTQKERARFHAANGGFKPLFDLKELQ